MINRLKSVKKEQLFNLLNITNRALIILCLNMVRMEEDMGSSSTLLFRLKKPELDIYTLDHITDSFISNFEIKKNHTGFAEDDFYNCNRQSIEKTIRDNIVFNTWKAVYESIGFTQELTKNIDNFLTLANEISKDQMFSQPVYNGVVQGKYVHFPTWFSFREFHSLSEIILAHVEVQIMQG